MNVWSKDQSQNPFCSPYTYHTIFCPHVWALWGDRQFPLSLGSTCGYRPITVRCQGLLDKPALLCLMIFILHRWVPYGQVSSTALGLVLQKQTLKLGFIGELIPANTTSKVEKWDMELKKFKTWCSKKQMGNKVPPRTAGRL